MQNLSNILESLAPELEKSIKQINDITNNMANHENDKVAAQGKQLKGAIKKAFEGDLTQLQKVINGNTNNEG